MTLTRVTGCAAAFPLSFLAEDDEASFHWRQEFVQTFLERDVPQLGFAVPAMTMYRFWSMVAHYHGQVWNAAEPARSLGIGETTVRRYLDLLCDLFMVRSLPAWHANLKKRQVKSPKVYFRDSGLLHHMLGIRDEGELLRHPKCGASWEGYVVEEVLRATEPDAAHFWATHQGAELDLLLTVRGKRYGVECKRVDAPRLTPSMRIAWRTCNSNASRSFTPAPAAINWRSAWRPFRCQRSLPAWTACSL